MASAADELNFTCTFFTLGCRGGAVDKVLILANKVGNIATISTLGVVGVSGILAWRTENPGEFLQAVTTGILGPIQNAFVQYVTGGSLTVEVVAKTKEADGALMKMYESGEMLVNLNKAVAEYASKFHQEELGHFDSVGLTNYNERVVTKDEIKEVENLSAASFEGFKRNQNLPQPFFIKPSEITLERDDNNTTILGTGGFGSVLLCYNEHLGHCAVKCMPSSYYKLYEDNAENILQRFEREAGILLKADHPNIVRVYGITSWVGSFGIIMEYMERGNLSVLIESARRHEFQIPFNLLVRILLHVANGVAFLHKIGEDQQIVHGDLKPSNIVLKDNFTAKVADFGGASLRTYTGTNESAFALAENTVHTQTYTAPERLANLLRPATKASDVYSYGLIIYECLTDRQEIKESKGELSCKRIEQKKKMCVGEERDNLVCLEKWMKSCWQHKKEERPKMKQVRDDLQRHFDKVARKHVLESIAKVSSKLEFITLSQTHSNQTIPINLLYPPFFRPSDVPKEFIAKASRHKADETERKVSQLQTYVDTPGDELQITLISIQCNGEVVHKVVDVAKEVSNTTASSKLGLIGPSATLVWLIDNPTVFLKALARGIIGNLENTFVHYVTGGSLTIEVVTKTKVAAYALIKILESGDMLVNLNKSINEYGEEFHLKIGQFDSVSLANRNERVVTKEDIETVEQKAEKYFKSFKSDQNIVQTIWIEPLEITLKRDKNAAALLGYGGYGSVVLCYYEPVGHCAVKCVSFLHRNLDDEGRKKKFFTEAGIILKAEHPNIVQVFGITRWIGSFGLVMEYMERGNLSELIQSARENKFQIPFNLLVRILLQIANGVAFLHKIEEDEQIVHGDLKPPNIVLKDDFTAKVADFGGASIRTYSGVDSTTPPAENKQHTLRYTAPERIQQPELAARKASDVYSYGMIIYECLSEHVPFHNAIREDILRLAIIQQKIQPSCDEIDAKKGECVGDQHDSLVCLERWMRSCWQFNQEGRPTMEQVRTGLQQHYDKVARKHVANSITEVSAKLGYPEPNYAGNAQTKPICSLQPPYFRPSDPHTETSKNFLNYLSYSKSSSYEDTIVPLIKACQCALNENTTKFASAVVSLNEALDELEEIGSSDCIRLVGELHDLCLNQEKLELPTYQKLVTHGARRCLGIQDQNLQVGFRSSFLEKLLPDSVAKFSSRLKVTAQASAGSSIGKIPTNQAPPFGFSWVPTERPRFFAEESSTSKAASENKIQSLIRKVENALTADAKVLEVATRELYNALKREESRSSDYNALFVRELNDLCGKMNKQKGSPVYRQLVHHALDMCLDITDKNDQKDYYDSFLKKM